MKITKVNNVKTAVVVKKEEHSQEGILYVDPSRQNEGRISVEDHVNSRSDSASNLYNIFNQLDKKSKEYTDNHKVVFNQINGEQGLGKTIRNLRFNAEQVLAYVSSHKQNADVSSDDIEFIASKLLRKSLRRVNVKSGLIHILLIYNGLETEISSEANKDIKAFLRAYKLDYNKSYSDRRVNGLSKNDKIVRSLTNQNMIVQPEKGSDEISLPIPAQTGKRTSHKRTEKEAFNVFMKMYASLDEHERLDILCKLRRIVDLYFYGEGGVPTELPDPWKDHSDKKGNETKFIEVDKDELNNDKISVEIRNRIRVKNIDRYRKSIKAVESNGSLYFDDFDINKFWIHHIENAVEKIFHSFKPNQMYKNELGYLSEKVWKDIINFLCIKYIAIGKAVYQFGMEDIKLDNQKTDYTYGTIGEDFADGINSFEYELIKAEETLQRDVSTYVAFAANNVGQALFNLDEKNSDWLLFKDAEITERKKENIKNNLLQFFGGKSQWPTDIFNKKSDDEVKKYSDDDVIKCFQDILYAMRNENFHFMTLNKNNGEWEKDLIVRMFEHEITSVSMTQKSKFYSNNLPLFYAPEELQTVLDVLYKKYVPRNTQVPSFTRVFVRKNFPDYLTNSLGLRADFSSENRCKEESDKLLEQWRSALYYLLKEVYYNAFLRDGRSKGLFLNAVDNLSNGNNKWAVESFKRRITAIKKQNSKWSLSEICQIIMTEQNQLNGSHRKVRSAAVENKHKSLYKHYEILLNQSLRDSFAQYVKGEEDKEGNKDNKAKVVFAPYLGFLFREKKITTTKPKLDKAEDFLPNWNCQMYGDLIVKVKTNPELQKWYITGRLLNPKQVNLFVGVVRHYLQYAWDVERRAKQNGCVVHGMNNENKALYENICEVLDVCVKLSGNISADVNDYFEDSKQYFNYLQKYIDVDPGQIDVYYDGTHPVLKRNIIISKLYGPEVLLPQIAEHVSQDDLDDYKDAQSKIASYKKNGLCSNEEEQKNLKAYQEIKNRVELHNVLELSELTNELLGQLISWCYLRERDLLYFQLGFHYMCLKSDNKKPDDYVSFRISLNGTEGIVNNAILYQIAAIYINGLSLYSKNDGGLYVREVNDGRVSTSGKIGQFTSYTKKCANIDSACFYNAGLELFENIKEHDDIIDLRNVLDHFHYYTDCAESKRSILSMYSEMFDRFFSYDIKNRKNVANILYGILLRHMVLTCFRFKSETKKVGENTKECASIAVSSLKSEDYTYKLKQPDGRNAGTVNIPAKSDRQLKEIAKLLYYPHSVPEDII